jgi:hypothetical protein
VSDQLAVVSVISRIRPHPDADRLEIMTFPFWAGEVDLVVGKHYRAGDEGMWLRPGAILPGWLARQLWMPTVDDEFEVRAMDMRGVHSPGLWCGRWYRNDSGVPSRLNSKSRAQGADREVDGWLHWGPWDPDWRLFDDVGDRLGVHARVAQAVEQPVANR